MVKKKGPGESTMWDNACKDKLRELIDQKLVNLAQQNPASTRPYYTLDPVFAEACPNIVNFVKNFKFFCLAYLTAEALKGGRRRCESNTQWDVEIDLTYLLIFRFVCLLILLLSKLNSWKNSRQKKKIKKRKERQTSRQDSRPRKKNFIRRHQPKGQKRTQTLNLLRKKWRQEPPHLVLMHTLKVRWCLV